MRVERRGGSIGAGCKSVREYKAPIVLVKKRQKDSGVAINTTVRLSQMSARRAVKWGGDAKWGSNDPESFQTARRMAMASCNRKWVTSATELYSELGKRASSRVENSRSWG